jgi:hypothetical protein
MMKKPEEWVGGCASGFGQLLKPFADRTSANPVQKNGEAPGV